jgi:uncharacterized protein (DUF952 family)
MIYHVTTEDEWNRNKDKDYYIPDRFQSDNFIHASTSLQVKRIANTIYKKFDQVLLLLIDDEKEKDFIKLENLEGGSELFPHIYHPLPKSSIIEIQRIKKNAEGLFELTSIINT